MIHKGPTPNTCAADIKMVAYKYFHRVTSGTNANHDPSCQIYHRDKNLVNGRYAWNTTNNSNIFWTGKAWVVNTCNMMNMCHVISSSTEDVDCPFGVELFQSRSARSTTKNDIYYLPIDTAGTNSNHYSSWSSWSSCTKDGSSIFIPLSLDI